jgi:thymidylate kinase
LVNIQRLLFEIFLLIFIKMILKLISQLSQELEKEKIPYCHWKSNFHLKDALVGKGDLDILVDRQDAQRFESILAALGFKRTVDPLQAPYPAVFHFYGLDNETSILVHLHVYYRVITGESLLKNYNFPLEKLLLQDPRRIGRIPVPQVPAELLLFVLRVMVKHTSLPEYFLLRRSYKVLREELNALLADNTAPSYSELLTDWLPSVNKDLFDKCVVALQKDIPFACRFWLALKLGRRLKTFNRFSTVSEMVLRPTLFLKRVFRRLRGDKKTKQFASGGAVIAFVGPEATGKSMLVKETASWLGKAFDVNTYHLGKPPSTWLTFLPNLLLPLLRRVAPQHCMSRVENVSSTKDSDRMSLLYSLRSIMIAWDRRALTTKVHRKAANGRIVICDRYPSSLVGAMDSAKLRIPEGKGWRTRLLGHLTRLESRIYQQIPPPDVVLRLTVPVEVAVERNRKRQKKGKETATYILHRHTTGVMPLFPTAKTVELDTNQPEPQVISSVRQIVWNVL